MLIGKMIEAYREKNNLSVRELAARIKVEHTALWKFERGKPVRTNNWVKILTWVLTGNE